MKPVLLFPATYLNLTLNPDRFGSFLAKKNIASIRNELNKNKQSIYKAALLVRKDYSMRAHGRTNARTERKIWPVYFGGNRNVFGFDLKESIEGFCRRVRGSFHVDGPKTEKAREPIMECLVREPTVESLLRKPTVESLVQEIWRLRISEAEWKVGEGV